MQIAVLAALILVVILIIYWGARRDANRAAHRDRYMTGYYIFPQTPGEGYSADNNPYPLVSCDPDSTPLARSGALYDGYYHGTHGSAQDAAKPAAEHFSAPYFGEGPGAMASGYSWPFIDPLERAKYGDRRPLCGIKCARPPGQTFCKPGATCVTFEALDRYYGAEYGWNYSFYY